MLLFMMHSPDPPDLGEIISKICILLLDKRQWVRTAFLHSQQYQEVMRNAKTGPKTLANYRSF